MRIQALRWAAFWLGLGPSALATAGGLDDYVKRPDPTFAWKVVGEDATEAGRVVHLDVTSQTWKGIVWQHRLRVYEPKAVKYPDAMLLFITGGNTESRAKADDHQFGFALAKLCGGRVAVLPQVPNQPLLGGKSEDTLIAETFIRSLETKDADWPLLLPMVKSAVRSMDAVQAWAKGASRPEVAKFVVAGASKRGWTTWLTGAVDPRVAGIAPMVIVTLNMKAQNANQLEIWGRNSEQIDDYTSRGLTDRFDAPERKALWELVDPYFYLDRLTMPKLLINGTNDRYWTLNALDLYWDDLRGPKNVVYLPNAGHGLDQNRDYALNGLGAFFRHVVTARPMPQVSWFFARPADGPMRLTVASSPPPKLAKVWTALAEKRDFRDSPWESVPMAADARMTADIPQPGKGRVAAFADLEYEIDGLTYHLATQIGQHAAKPTP